MTHESDSTGGEYAADELRGRFRAVLDRHGHGFHYAVIQRISELFDRQQRWLFECAEFPVSVGLYETRIDFILRTHEARFFLVCECKRVNPAMAHWCFVRAPFVRRNRTHERIFVECVLAEYKEGEEGERLPHQVFCRGATLGLVENAYHIGYEVKNARTHGDPGGKRGVIEEAAGQVLKGTNGLINTLSRMGHVRRNEFDPGNKLQTVLMPAIFTTAKLWTSSAKLAEADLSTGQIAPDQVDLAPVPWLFLQYPVSPSLKSDSDSGHIAVEISTLLDAEHMRSIAIVNADGIEQFFQQFYPDEDSVSLIRY